MSSPPGGCLKEADILPDALPPPRSRPGSASPGRRARLWRGRRQAGCLRVCARWDGCLLRKGGARVVTVKLLVLQVAAPGVAAGLRRPIEPLAVLFGEFMAIEGADQSPWRNPRHRTCASAERKVQSAAPSQTPQNKRRPVPVKRRNTVARSAMAGPASTRTLAPRDGLGFVMGCSSQVGVQGLAVAAGPLRPRFPHPRLTSRLGLLGAQSVAEDHNGEPMPQRGTARDCRVARIGRFTRVTVEHARSPPTKEGCCRPSVVRS